MRSARDIAVVLIKQDSKRFYVVKLRGESDPAELVWHGPGHGAAPVTYASLAGHFAIHTTRASRCYRALAE